MENNYAEYATFMGKVLCADTQTHNLWYQTARGTRVLRLEKYFHFLAPTFLYLLIIYLFNYHAAYIISNTGGFGCFFFFPMHGFPLYIQRVTENIYTFFV